MSRTAKSFDAELVREYIVNGHNVCAIRIYRDDRTGAIKPYEIWSVASGAGFVGKGTLTRCSSFRTMAAAVASAERWRDQVAAGEYDQKD